MSEVITGEIKGITKIDSKVEFIEDIMSFLGNEANFKTDGVFEIGKVKAIIMTIEKNHTKSELNKLEVHENYHDLHVTLEGKDNIAFLRKENFNWPDSNFNKEEDYGFIKSNSLKFKVVKPFEFCFIPAKVPHMALYARQSVKRKIVFKIPN